MHAEQTTFVIAGGGRIVLVGAEDERPYERPPLSKDVLRGDEPRDSVYVHPAEYYDEHTIELLTGRSAQSLDTGARQLTLDDGSELGYDRLLIATGAEPRRFEVPGS